MPAGQYTLDELDYLRETARTDSVYGVSRVERILLRVNQALRKQDFDLARFTDGVAPLGLIEPPESLEWTPDDLETFERLFNGMLAGNDQLRVRAKVLPPGATWRALGGDDPLLAFDSPTPESIATILLPLLLGRCARSWTYFAMLSLSARYGSIPRRPQKTK
jgi:hypothetical protein